MNALNFISIFLLKMVIVLRTRQLSKASIPIVVTLSGMISDSIFWQLVKACSPIVFTLFGITIDLRLMQL